MSLIDRQRLNAFCSLTARSTRRLFLGGMAVSAIPIAWAQGPRKIQQTKIGWVALREPIFREPYSQAFVARLGELGLREGNNLTLERSDAGDNLARMPDVIGKLVENRPDVLFGAGGEATFVALKNLNQGIPTVFVSVDYDPVQSRHVDKISRPGGSITGISGNQSQLPAKRLELLKLLIPTTKSIGVLSNPETLGQLEVVRNTAKSLGVHLEVVEFSSLPFDYEMAFNRLVHAGVDSLIVLGSSLFVSARQKIPQLALAHRLPTVFHQAQWADAGGLMSYGYSFTSMWRTGADMVFKVTRGVPVSEIPMEYPATYELVINLTTARILGIEIPYEMKLRADRLIA